MLIRAALIACCLALPAITLAEEKVAKKPVGTWVRESGGHKLAFAIKADNTLTITLGSSEGSVSAEAAYGVTADGTLFGVLTKVEKKGIENGPQKGDLFSFDFSAGKSEMTISNLKGTRTNEDAARVVEGVYGLEKKKKK
jgi:hypothetical protein